MLSSYFSENTIFNNLLKFFKKTKPFDEEMFSFINGPISFLDEDGKPIHIQVLATEHIQHPLGDELRLQFSVGDEQLADEGKPHMGKFRGGQKMRVALRPGETYTYAPIFWYTFSSQLSHDENRRNLREFVLSHYRKAAAPPE